MKPSASRFILLFSVLSLGVLANSLVHDDIICENRGTKDETCYPRVFQATEEFQPVRPGQAIPKGLHVRLNLQTGQKEAKLYDPSKDTDPVNAIEVFPDEPPSSVNVTAPLDDRPQMAFDEDHNPGHQEQLILSEMRKVAMDAPIKPPIGTGGDMKLFQDSKAQIYPMYNKEAHSSATEVRKAWDDLEDLCHDVYWGLQLTKDQDFLKVLYDGVTTNAGAWDERGMSARILGTALQNNKAAIDAFRKYVSTRDGLVRSESSQAPTKTFIDLVSEQYLSLNVERDTELVYMVSKLLGDEAFLTDFLSGDALFNLKRTLYRHRIGGTDTDFELGRTKEPLKYGRILNKAKILVSDHILIDELASKTLLAIHEPFEACHDSQTGYNECIQETSAGPALRKALVDRVKWCNVFETAFDIVFSHDLGHQDKETDDYTLRTRWIPRHCDWRSHDVPSGQLHPGLLELQ